MKYPNKVDTRISDEDLRLLEMFMALKERSKSDSLRLLIRYGLKEFEKSNIDMVQNEVVCPPTA